MACQNGLRTNFLSGASAGGSWVYDGYNSSSPAGPFSSGGTTPPALVGDNPSIDFDGWIAGFYAFTYNGGSAPCDGSQQIVVAVVQSGNPGDDTAITLCTADAPINIYSTLGANIPTTGFQPPNWNYGGDIGNPGYDSGSGGSPTDDTFDPSLSGTGTFNITLTVTPDNYTGYPLDDCDNCQAQVATLTITVQNTFNAGTPQQVSVCN